MRRNVRIENCPPSIAGAADAAKSLFVSMPSVPPFAKNIPPKAFVLKHIWSSLAPKQLSSFWIMAQQLAQKLDRW
jgi:hypothetical protein